MGVRERTTGKPRASLVARLTAVGWRNLAALPPLGMAAAYLIAIHWPEIFSEKPRYLYLSMQIEFLVIHSFPFVAMIALAKPKARYKRVLRQIGFWGLLAIYIGFAAMSGLEGVALFLSLVLVTYLGMLLNLKSEAAMAELGARWLFLFIASIAIWALNDMPQDVGNWDRTERTLHSGWWYFLLIAALEGIGFFRSPALTRS